MKQCVPICTTHHDANTAYAFLIKCGCKKASRGHCKCSWLILGVQHCVVAKEDVQMIMIMKMIRLMNAISMYVPVNRINVIHIDFVYNYHILQMAAFL